MTFAPLFRDAWVVGLEIQVVTAAGASGPVETGSSAPVCESGSFFDSVYPSAYPLDLSEAKDYKLTMSSFRPLYLRYPVHQYLKETSNEHYVQVSSSTLHTVPAYTLLKTTSPLAASGEV